MYGKIVKITLRRRVSPDKKCELYSLFLVNRTPHYALSGGNGSGSAVIGFRSNEAKLPRLGLSEAICGFGGERDCGQGPSCGLVPFNHADAG